MRREDFERLYADHAQDLFGFLAYRAGDRAVAEDLLADTFERAIKARRRYDPRKASAKSWIYAIALNCLRDHKRREQAEVRAVERFGAGVPEATQDAWLERVEDREQLRLAMAVLSEDERETVALRYGGDLTVPEISKVLGEKLTTVEGRLYRALRKLASELG